MTRTLIAVVLTSLAIGGSTSRTAAQSAPCTPSGGLTFICGVQNPEDLVLVPGTRWLVASGMTAGSGLHLVDTRAKSVRNLYATDTQTVRADKTRFAACPGPLDPKLMVLHGLSIRPAQPGRYTVYATNHGGRESIEAFELDTRGAAPSVAWVGCVPMPNEMAANSVAAFKDGTLVATVLIMPGKTFVDAFAGRNTGAVFMWTPGSAAFKMLPGTELPANNGIETSLDDREFFVVSTTLKRVVVFARDNPGTPLRVAQLAEFGPDNVRYTSDNRLITAGMIDNEPACGGPAKTEEDIRCARGYIVATIDPKTMAVKELARGQRTTSYTGTAMAIPVGDELWLGSFYADRLAYQSLKP